MHRSEKRNAFIGWLMAALLILSIPAAMFRLNMARAQLKPKEVMRLTDESGSILDREGTVLFAQNQAYYQDVLGSVIGSFGQESTLLGTHSQYLVPEIPVFGGIEEAKNDNTMKTTLLEPQILRELAAEFGSKGGACYAYDYVTGEILCLLSVDGQTSYTGGNRCLTGLYTPGSTMKVVTSILALQDDPLFREHFQVRCEGEEILPGGIRVKCSGNHHKTDALEALGQSCNIAYAQIAAQLAPVAARENLQNLGFSLNSEDYGTLETVSGLRKSRSTIEYEGDGSYNSIWGLVGQGKTSVNLMDMAQIAGAVANGGEAAEPYLVEAVLNRKGRAVWKNDSGNMTALMTPETAQAMEQYWTEAFDTYYGQGSRKLDPVYTYAKTGTAQLGSGLENKLLLGVAKDYHIAFMIVVEHYESGDPTPNQIANKLAEYFPQLKGEMTHDEQSDES